MWIALKNNDNFFGLSAKAYTYLIDEGSEDKNPKGNKVCHKKKT